MSNWSNPVWIRNRIPFTDRTRQKSSESTKRVRTEAQLNKMRSFSFKLKICKFFRRMEVQREKNITWRKFIIIAASTCNLKVLIFVITFSVEICKNSWVSLVCIYVLSLLKKFVMLCSPVPTPLYYNVFALQVCIL
jgi:hypothetical protein